MSWRACCPSSRFNRWLLLLLLQLQGLQPCKDSDSC